VLAPMI